MVEPCCRPSNVLVTVLETLFPVTVQLLELTGCRWILLSNNKYAVLNLTLVNDISIVCSTRGEKKTCMKRLLELLDIVHGQKIQGSGQDCFKRLFSG